MKLDILPKTTLGKWSVGLALAFGVFCGAFLLLVATGQRGGEAFFSNLLLTVPMLLSVICGVAAFPIGVIAVIRDKERAVLVFLSALIGIFILWFLLGEIMFPH